MTPKRILYIHHGHARGGAFLSLLYLLRSLDRAKYEPIVCNGGDEQDPRVEEVFAAEGFTTYSCRMPRFAHTVGGYPSFRISSLKAFYRWFNYFPTARGNFIALLKQIRPDAVHFNSLTLAPYTRITRQAGVPSVVHVRESALRGIFGIRASWLRSHLVNNASIIIAICNDNLERLNLPEGKGVIIYNPVDFKTFDYRIEKSVVQKTLGVDPDAQVALFAGGSVWDAKGLSEFLEAMRMLRRNFPNLVCLMPGFSLPGDPTKRVWTIKRRTAQMLGMYRKSDRLFRLLKEEHLDTLIIRSDFVYDIENWLAACDVVCVPHVQPHFSRMVMEAGAMKKPVVGFDIGGVTEVVENSRTGLLVECGNVASLADSVGRLLLDTELAGQLSEGGYRQAVDKFDAECTARQVDSIYRGLFCHEF